MRPSSLLLILAASLALGGCAASIAASALGAAVRAATPAPRYVTEDLRSFATEACRARAAQAGSVHIIDAEQREDGRVTVWGTVEDERQRRSFECVHDGEVRAFRLREIRAP